MSMYDEWMELAGGYEKKEEYDKFWNEYFEKETENYEYILENHEEVLSGSLVELADKFGMDSITMVGFLDGINTSLVETLNIEEVSEESQINLEIDFEKLYFNMLDAKAHWLYNLPQWEDILSTEKREEITSAHKQSQIAVSNKIGRNEPCPCGSGKKYKKCCG